MITKRLTERAKKYSGIKTRIFVIDLFVTLISLAAFQLFLSRPILHAVHVLCSNYYIALLIYCSVFLFIMYLAGFPAHFVSSFLVERRFSLSRQDLAAWLSDEGKSIALSFLLSMVCIQVFYLVLRNFQHAWWYILAAAWIIFSIVLARLMPIFLIPIFFKYLPVEEGSLRQGIISMAEKAKVRVVDVCGIDFSRKTTKANAALVGLGNTRKVILADTLTSKFTTKEVEVVVAHEFGHYRYRHMWQLLAFSSVCTVAGFYGLALISEKITIFVGAAGFSDIYIFPSLVFLATVFGVFLMPVQNLFSRALERQADRFALELTGSPEEFISVMEKLALMNLADKEPSLLKKIFLFNHPPIVERVRMAEKVKLKMEKEKGKSAED